ncbi:CLUMA_CG016209, isoform A [Clunio marinus]|uniref:CLUMA_CG016209, isoform A n=1 Tax=Clunio marinus TaxID=568069 RepID=A0A1J1ISV6_9DIPT|nr:CLUMA_CG016209, isoform A [Clunio marinus]
MDMIPDEKFEAHCTMMLVTGDEHQQKEQIEQQEQQQPYDIRLSAFSDIYNEYLSDHSEIETASTSDTDSSSSASLSNPTSITSKENYENIRNNQKKSPDIRSNLHNNQLFGVQLEVNFLLLEAERRKLKVLKQELNLSLDDCDKLERKKRSHNQCHELLLAISRIQSQHNLLEKELADHTIDILKYSNIRIIEKNNRNQPAIGLKQTSKARVSHTSFYKNFLKYHCITKKDT